MSNGKVTTAELLEFATPAADGSDPVKVAAASLEVAHSLVESYTRGNHVDRYGHYRPGIRGVILSVSARLLANPGQIITRVTVGGLTISKGVGFQGFTLAEQAALNRYRRRAVG